MNIIEVVDSNITKELKELNDEKENCLKKLAQIYGEIARHEFIAASVSYTSHFNANLPKAIQVPAHSGDMVKGSIDFSRSESKKDAHTSA